MSIAVSFLALTCLCLCTVLVQARHYDGVCPPTNPRSCGNSTLLSEASTPLTDSDRPNVCNVTKIYEVQSLAYETINFCFGRRRCRPYCTPTRNCTGPKRNVSISKIQCCDGFAVAPEDETVHHHHWSRTAIPKQKGCSLMLRESVTECLLELNLDDFAFSLLSQAPDAANELGNSNSQDSFTVFGLNSTDTDDFIDVSTLGYIVNKTVTGKRLLGGTVLATLLENVFLHVGTVDRKSVFVNGAEVTQLNACQARNGIVHIVNSPIPQSSMTIAAILRQDSRFSSFLRLVDGANITAFLDVAKGKSRTLLAPTNDAFDKLPANAVECLLQAENSKYLSQLVLIHVSSPAEYTATLSQRSRLYTFNRRYYLVVGVEGDDILVTKDLIALEESDIPANNGVIHALPEVIVPPEVDFDKLNCDASPEVGGA